MTEHEMIAWAFRIADESMRELLECSAIRVDEFGHVWSFVDDDGAEANTLAVAAPAIVEACEWLQARGIGEVMADPNGGEFFLVTQFD